MSDGFTIWLTGLSGAGKSTLAHALEAALTARGRRVEVLDGDVVREHLSQGLGFSKADRDTNIRRIAFVADLLTRHGAVAIVAAISPYREARDAARQQIGAFVEVHVRCSLDTLVARDVKGLYARALRGEVPHFTGVSDPYEESLTPEVVVDSDRETVDESAAKILTALERLGYLAQPVVDPSRPEGPTSLPGSAGVSPARPVQPAPVQRPGRPRSQAEQHRLPPETVARWARELAGHEPPDVLRAVLGHFPRERVALCTSFQVDGTALLDMAWRIDPRLRVFTIDTGRLPAETYALIDQVRTRYGVEVEMYLPDAAEVERMVTAEGPNLFYRAVPLRLRCCEVRKVHPTRRVLSGLDAWITGLRRDQYTTRAAVEVVEADQEHGAIVKVNPLAYWTEAQVWDYVRANDVPVHSLYAQGYTSIGCAPCTRPVAPGEGPRAGRWWWEQDAPKECGMHCAIELVGTGPAQERD